jgi:hypothetical protein
VIARLTRETLGELRLRYLQRDDPVQSRIASLPHLTHTTLADERKDLAGAEFIACRSESG